MSTTSTSSTDRTTRTDVYTRVTDSIVAALEKGVRPWLKPWSAKHLAGHVSRPLRHNGQKYSGVNIVTLWMAAEAHGYASPFWMTFQQAKELGGNVRKGEHGSPVVYAATFKKKETSDTGDEVEQDIPFLKEYTVFNANQCENLPPHFTALKPVTTQPVERIERADRFFAALKADIRTGGTQAYYAMGTDHIQMPPFESFRDAESYVATLGHECVHWTKHSTRLDRDLGRKRWGDAGYALEELTAELGAAFLCADLEITPEVREDHASYIDHWLQVLKQDKRAVFTAASHASKAVDFLTQLQPPAPDDTAT